MAGYGVHRPRSNDEPRGRKKGRARTGGIEYSWFPVKDRLANSGEAARNSGLRQRGRRRSKRAARTRVTMLTGKTRSTAVRRGARNFCHDKNQWNKALPPTTPTEKPQIEIQKRILLWTRVSLLPNQTGRLLFRCRREKKRITVIVLPLHRTIPFYYSNRRSVNVSEL